MREVMRWSSGIVLTGGIAGLIAHYQIEDAGALQPLSGVLLVLGIVLAVGSALTTGSNAGTSPQHVEHRTAGRDYSESRRIAGRDYIEKQNVYHAPDIYDGDDILNSVKTRMPFSGCGFFIRSDSSGQARASPDEYQTQNMATKYVGPSRIEIRDVTVVATPMAQDANRRSSRTLDEFLAFQPSARPSLGVEERARVGKLNWAPGDRHSFILEGLPRTLASGQDLIFPRFDLRVKDPARLLDFLDRGSYEHFGVDVQLIAWTNLGEYSNRRWLNVQFHVEQPDGATRDYGPIPVDRDGEIWR